MPGRLDVAVSGPSTEGQVVVTPVGGLDVSTAGTLETAIGDVLAPGVSVIIDLSGLSSCDSTGLGALVRLHRRAQRVEARFAIRNPRQPIRDMLTMTGINKVLEVLPGPS